MSPQQKPTDAFEQTIAAIPSCALDESGARKQRARYARLAPSVASLEREPEALLIEFVEDLDRQMLDETLDIERTCCPFFQVEFDAAQRLRITVEEDAQLQALDAIAYALGGAHQGARG
jgi:hypothetical protein